MDAEVADFFARKSHGLDRPIIDERTNARLRWLIHKRVLVGLYFSPLIGVFLIAFRRYRLLW